MIATNGLSATRHRGCVRARLSIKGRLRVLRDTLAVVITALVVDVTAANYARPRRAIYNTLPSPRVIGDDAFDELNFVAV